ncbi:MAG: HD domain-containing protein [Patescibacteria group bacterium]
MPLPTKDEAKVLLKNNVKGDYQRFHAKMVASLMEGYANKFGEDDNLWYITGLLHDIDFESFPNDHPAKSLEWFRGWNYPQELIHAIEAHAYGYNGFSTLPETKLASTLLACDEITGIFYAYQKMNPIPFGQMKVNSIKKKFNQKDFAATVDRELITLGCNKLGIEIEDHIENVVFFLNDWNEPC